MQRPYCNKVQQIEAINLKLFVRVFIICLFFLWFMPFVSVPIFSQEFSEGEFIPPKASGSSSITEKPVNIQTSPNTSRLPDKDSFEELTGFSVSAVVILMLLGGLILLFIEVAIIPGFGLTGISGIILIFAALALAFWKLDIKLAVVYSIVSIIVFILMGLWVAYVFPYTTMGKKFVLQTTISVESGYVANEDVSRFIGQEGVASSDLRPCGIARLGDNRLDVMSEGDFIPHGTRIKVIKAKNNNLIVIPIAEPDAKKDETIG